jgi:hypothetical protein
MTGTGEDVVFPVAAATMAGWLILSVVFLVVPTFMTAFRGEVTEDAVQRGLTRPRPGGRRIALPGLVLLVPAGALALALVAAHQPEPFGIIDFNQC